MAPDKSAPDTNPFITGFLSDTFANEGVPDYGYHENHLPTTRDRERQIQSVMGLIDWTEDEDD